MSADGQDDSESEEDDDDDDEESDESEEESEEESEDEPEPVRPTNIRREISPASRLSGHGRKVEKPGEKRIERPKGINNPAFAASGTPKTVAEQGRLKRGSDKTSSEESSGDSDEDSDGDSDEDSNESS